MDSFLTVIFLIAVGIGGLWAVIHSQKLARDRTGRLAGWAAANGFYFHGGKVKSFADEHPVLRCLGKGHSRYAYNVANGEWRGIVFTSFDYHYATGSGKNRRVHRFSGLLLKPPHRLKPIIVRPEGFFDRVKAGFGLNDIDFESAEFSKKFYVSAIDKSWAYDLIHTRTMEFLMLNSLSRTRFSFECDHEVLCVLSENNRVLEIPGFEAAYDFGVTVLNEIPEYVRKNL